MKLLLTSSSTGAGWQPGTVKIMAELVGQNFDFCMEDGKKPAQSKSGPNKTEIVTMSNMRTKCSMLMVVAAPALDNVVVIFGVRGATPSSLWSSVNPRVSMVTFSHWKVQHVEVNREAGKYRFRNARVVSVVGQMHTGTQAGPCSRHMRQLTHNSPLSQSFITSDIDINLAQSLHSHHPLPSPLAIALPLPHHHLPPYYRLQTARILTGRQSNVLIKAAPTPWVQMAVVPIRCRGCFLGCSRVTRDIGSTSRQVSESECKNNECLLAYISVYKISWWGFCLPWPLKQFPGYKNTTTWTEARQFCRDNGFKDLCTQAQTCPKDRFHHVGENYHPEQHIIKGHQWSPISGDKEGEYVHISAKKAFAEKNCFTHSFQDKHSRNPTIKANPNIPPWSNSNEARRERRWLCCQRWYFHSQWNFLLAICGARYTIYGKYTFYDSITS